MIVSLQEARIALCERLIKYSDDIHCIAIHRDLSNDLREAEALITLLSESPATVLDTDWLPIASIRSEHISTQTVLWNPCDGVHLLSILSRSVDIERLRDGSVFTHFRKLDAPRAADTPAK